MAAPTNAAYVKKALANSEPSTHGCTDQCCLREESSCQLGAVHTWHEAAVRRVQNYVRFLRYSSREMLAVRLSQFDPLQTSRSWVIATSPCPNPPRLRAYCPELPPKGLSPFSPALALQAACAVR